jgi:hypothetical protein
MNVVHALVGLFAAVGMTACAPVIVPQTSGPISITLSRSVCYGFCPAYTVTITGDGQVTYVGGAYVNVMGEQHAMVSPSDVQSLLARFDAIHFDSLQDAYRAEVTDLPTYTITLERNGRRKAVEDYSGLSAGMPEAVRQL